ncbi:MAG TPA: hypothetical protein VME66_10045 [Candidatus Acidoferrales bacterium]|nr:hypothetical protein [Candidatus Acidoferrales bacterium]
MHDLWSVFILGLVVVLVVVRNLRPQRMNVTRLWLAPGVLAIVTLLVLTGSLEARLSAPLVAILSAVGAALGVPFGMLRGRLQTVRKTKNPKVLLVEPSVVTLLVWLAAFGLRFGLRFAFGGAASIAPVLGDAFLSFAVASLVAARYVIYTKFKALHAA